MAIDNLVTGGATSDKIASLRSFQDQPIIQQELFSSFGEGFRLSGFFSDAAGRSVEMSGQSVTGEEETFIHRTFKIGSVIAGTTADVAIVTLDPDEFDTQGNFYPRLNDTLVVGNTITGFTEVQIGLIGVQSAPNTQFTLNRYSNTATTLTAQVTAGTLAAGVELPLGANAYAVETGQPTPTNIGTRTRTNYPQIIKETIAFGGHALAQQKWIKVNGGTQLFNRECARAEYMMKAKQEMLCIMGQLNTNNLSQTSVYGNQNKISKSKGVYTWIEELGGDLLIGSAGAGVDDLDTIENYLISVGIQDKVVALYGGHTALSKLMKNVTSKVQGSSGALVGSPYVNEVQDRLFGGNTISVNFNVQYIKGTSHTFVLIPSPIFSNPKYLGTQGTMLNDAFIVIPLNQATVTIDGAKMTIPNLRKRFVGMDGYSRESIVGTLGGMDGYAKQKLGLPIISSIDAFSMHWLSEICFEYYEAFKGMIIKRNA